MKTILFDFGNVIGYFDHRRALRHLKAYTSLTDQELYAAYYDSVLEDEYERGYMSTAQFVQTCFRLGGLTCSPEVFLNGYCDIFTPNRAVCELIPLLKPRYRLVLASNTNQAHSDHYRQEFAETLKYFDALCLSFEAGARKPEMRFFHYCQNWVQCETSECLFIDDVEKNVIAAEAFGWKGIVYNEFADLVRKLKDAGIEF